MKGSISKLDTLDNNQSASADGVRGREVYPLVFVELHAINQEPVVDLDAQKENCLYRCLYVTLVKQRKEEETEPSSLKSEARTPTG